MVENLIEADRVKAASRTALMGRNPQRVAEAVGLLRHGLEGSPRAQLHLMEALSTSDFRVDLAAGMNVQVLDLYRDYVPEWTGLAARTTTPDFRPKKFREMYGLDSLDRVHEGEEYRGTTLDETEFELAVEKFGRTVNLTWELQINRDFTALANLPRRLVNAARRTEDKAVFSRLVAAGTGGPNPVLFTGATAASKLPLNAENLQKVWGELALRRDRNGNAVQLSDMVLVVHPSQKIAADLLVNSAEVEITEGNRKTRVTNPFRGLFTVKAPQILADLDTSQNAATTWYLIPGAASSTPALGIAFLQGHETPDVRYKNDQGRAVGGGDIPAEEGSFSDDTISYRVRHVVGGASLFGDLAYASTGA